MKKFENTKFCDIEIDNNIITREIEKLKKRMIFERDCILCDLLMTFKFCIFFSKKSRKLFNCSIQTKTKSSRFVLKSFRISNFNFDKRFITMRFINRITKLEFFEYLVVNLRVFTIV